jgi:hypothetical protein
MNCNSCGYINDNTKFCTKCGSKVTSNIAGNKKSQKYPRSRRYLLLFPLVIVIILPLIYLLVSLNQNKEFKFVKFKYEGFRENEMREYFDSSKQSLTDYLSDNGDSSWSFKGCIDNGMKEIFDNNRSIKLQQLSGEEWINIKSLNSSSSPDDARNNECNKQSAFPVDFKIKLDEMNGSAEQNQKEICYRIVFPIGLFESSSWNAYWCVTWR